MATFPCTVSRGVRCYNLTAGKTTIEMEQEAFRKHKSLRYDPEYRDRTDFMQLFEFEASGDFIDFTPDGQNIVALGRYPPELHVYQNKQLSLKFSRRLDEVANSVVPVESDWRKLAILREDRYIEFHTQAGRHFQTRIPAPGRGLEYNGITCDLLIPSSTGAVYRLNLEQGRFMAPLETSMDDIETAAINPVHSLFGFGGKGGVLELWDPRDLGSGKPAARTVISSPKRGETVCDVMSLAFKHDGVHACVGLSTGHVQLYDLRSTQPVFTVDHRYGLPIKRVAFHKDADKVVSMDRKVIKYWEPEGELFTTITAEKDVNDFALCPGTGLIVFAAEQRRLQARYLPAIGPAPRWCSYVDTITEEMEQTQDVGTAFSNLKFVSRDDIETMGLTDLLGTKHLRPYMHGFFMDLTKYNEAAAIANPLRYEAVRADRVARRVEEKRKKSSGDRITKSRKIKVNQRLARAMSDADAPGARKRAAKAILSDNRFSALFQDPDFEVKEDEDMPVVQARMFGDGGGGAGANSSSEEEQSEDEMTGQLAQVS